MRDGLGDAQHLRDLAQHAPDLVLEVLAVANHAQVGVARPGATQLLVERACQLHALGARLVVANGVELGSTIGSGNEVKHSVVARVAQLLDGDVHLLGYRLPGLGTQVYRDVHRAAVTHQQHRLLALGGDGGKAVLDVELHLQRRFLGLIELCLVLCQVVNAAHGKHRRHLGDGIHLIAQVGEMLHHLSQRGGLTSARAASEHHFCYFAHRYIVIG